MDVAREIAKGQPDVNTTNQEFRETAQGAAEGMGSFTGHMLQQNKKRIPTSYYQLLRSGLVQMQEVSTCSTRSPENKNCVVRGSTPYSNQGGDTLA
eukprot:1159741-Pelagomonas_calceolata.AAC.5